jgi:dipeptidyl aminopeptidase/acylaminoacyl peptidase
MLRMNLLWLVVLAPVEMAAAPPDDAAWEKLADGSLGQAQEFHGVGGLAIPAYVRKPAGAGPFPVVVLAHGGRYGKEPTLGMGRSQNSPVVDFIREGWVIYSIDYRPAEVIAVAPIEFDDTVEAVKTVRRFPFIDPRRVAYMGGSHGAQVGARVISRVDLSGAILCAPAAMDLAQDQLAINRGERLVPILHKMIADLEKQYGAAAEDIAANPARYRYTSPLTEAEKVRCPVLLINGRNDDNSPVSVVELYVEKLRAAGKRVDTYLPDNGPHGFYFGRPDGFEYRESTRRATAFLRKCFGRGE